EGIGSEAQLPSNLPEKMGPPCSKIHDARRHPAGIEHQPDDVNRILHDGIAPNALARFDRDVLAQPRLPHVIVLHGINDIGLAGLIPAEAVTAEQIIEGHKQLIERAHARGLTIYGATLTPFEGATILPGFFTPEGEVKRQAVNAWIRTGGE